MEDFQKWALGLLFIIAVAIIYGQLFPPITKAPLFSTQTGSFADYISIRSSLNVSNMTNFYDGNTGSVVSSNYYKGVIEMIRVNARGTNVTLSLLDDFNNATIFAFGYVNGTNVTRNLGISVYGPIHFNVTGGNNVINGSMVYVDVIYRGA